MPEDGCLQSSCVDCEATDKAMREDREYMQAAKKRESACNLRTAY